MPSDEEKQRIATYLAARRAGGELEDPELYREVREEIHREHPVHSLHRGALVHEAYGAALRNRILLKDSKLDTELKKMEMSPAEYLRAARANARQHGYNPTQLRFANDGKHKLIYESPEGPRRFGRVGYRDDLMWRQLERRRKVRQGMAAQKRKTFRESHEKISETYQLGKHSPNELALKILWG